LICVRENTNFYQSITNKQKYYLRSIFAQYEILLHQFMLIVIKKKTTTFLEWSCMVDEIFFTVSHTHTYTHKTHTFISAVKVETRMLEFLPFAPILLFQHVFISQIVLFQKF